jgi:shikimate kinase
VSNVYAAQALDQALPMTLSPALRSRTIALVGLPGVGKSSIGRRLAAALGLPFRDADEEIERAAGRSISEIFAERGEAEFREGERRVIARLLDEPPHVLATGGGAFMNVELISEKATSIWLRADLQVLARRVARKNNRPLLRGDDPHKILITLAEQRHPVYAVADITIDSAEAPHSATVSAILDALEARVS